MSIQYEVVARTGVTPVPDGVGAITVFGESPAVDSSGNVVFLAGGGTDNNGNSQAGVYTYIGGQLQKVADMNTPVPGGGGATFTTFYADDRNDIDNGRVAFTANTSSSGTVLGLYSNVGQSNASDLVEVALADGGEWDSISDPWVDGETVAMRAQRLIPDNHTTILDWSGSNNSMGFVDPGTGYLFIPTTQASISGDATIFARGTLAGAWELAISSGGTYETLVDIDSTAMPGQAGTIFSKIYDFPVIDRGGLDAAFRGFGDQVQGLYKRTNGGALEVVADVTQVAPSSGENSFTFFSEAGFALANGQIVFSASGSNFLNGIYTDIGGALSVIVDDKTNNTIVLDGQTEQISNILFNHKSFAYMQRGYMVVFRAVIESGSTAIIKATITLTEQSSADVIFSSGFE